MAVDEVSGHAIELLVTQTGRFLDTHGSSFEAVAYEDLVDGDLGRACAYLDLELETTTIVPNHHRRVARSLGYGEWRNWFTDEDVDYYEPLLNRMLERLGYRDDCNCRTARSSMRPRRLTT